MENIAYFIPPPKELLQSSPTGWDDVVVAIAIEIRPRKQFSWPPSPRASTQTRAPSK